MDSHLFRKASYRLPALAGIAVLRFNTRGTSSVQGTSEGAFDNAVGERFDVAAAIEYAEFSDLPNIWLVGLVVRHRSDADARLGPGRPRARSCSRRRCGTPNPNTWPRGPSPASRSSPSFRSSTTTSSRRRRASGSRRSHRPRSSRVDGAKHLWVGDTERALDEIVARLAPDVPLPLPTHLGRPDGARRPVCLPRSDDGRLQRRPA